VLVLLSRLQSRVQQLAAAHDKRRQREQAKLRRQNLKNTLSSWLQKPIVFQNMSHALASWLPSTVQQCLPLAVLQSVAPGGGAEDVAVGSRVLQADNAADGAHDSGGKECEGESKSGEGVMEKTRAWMTSWSKKTKAWMRREEVQLDKGLGDERAGVVAQDHGLDDEVDDGVNNTQAWTMRWTA
jgi:hypothetical protein